MQSRSKEKLYDDKANFFEKSSREAPQQKSSYTREYSYNIDSETLRHSGQSDPRGLGFSYEKSSQPNVPSNRSAPSQHKGTALAFTYNPQIPTKTDLNSDAARTPQKDSYSNKSTEPKQAAARLQSSQKTSKLFEQKNYQTRTKSPDTKNETKQSNIDESSELSSTSQESMVDEYAKESMRQKTSALIAGSTANTMPNITESSLYKKPSTLLPSPNDNLDSTRAKLYSKQSEQYSSHQPTKRSSLWDQETRSSSSRLPVLSPTDSSAIERKYTQVSLVAN